MSETLTKIGVAMALIVGILFNVGAIVSLATDLIPEPHLLSYDAMSVAIVATAIGMSIIIVIGYLVHRKMIAPPASP